MLRILVTAALLGLTGLCSQARADDPVRLRIAYVPVVGAAPILVVNGAGWAKQEGIEMVPVRFESGPPAINALASGTIDALAIGIAPIAVARAKGLDVKVVAATATGGSAFVASASLAASLAKAGSDVAAGFADFRQAQGRPAKLATLPPGGVPTVTLNHWLFALNKVAKSDVQISAMGIDAVQQAVLSGAVDGGTVLEPSLTIVLDRDPKLKQIVTATQMFDNIPGVVLAVSGSFRQAHGATVEKLISLLVRASDLIARDPQAAAAYVQPVLGGGLVDQGTLAKALKSKAVSFVSDPRAIMSATQSMLAYQVELGDFDKAPPTEGLFDPSYFDAASGGR